MDRHRLTRPRLRLALLLLTLLPLVPLVLAGCALSGGLALTPGSGSCPDGLPRKLLVDAYCPRGVCGYTCAPDRWLLPPPVPAAVPLVPPVPPPVPPVPTAQ